MNPAELKYREHFIRALAKVDPDTILCLGKPGSEPEYQLSFYRLFVRVGRRWWRFENNYGSPSTERPTDLLIGVDSLRPYVPSIICGVRQLYRYKCDPTKDALREVMSRLQGIGKELNDRERDDDLL